MAHQVNAEIQYDIRNGKTTRFTTFGGNYCWLLSKIEEKEEKQMMEFAEKHRTTVRRQLLENLAEMKEDIYHEVVIELLSQSGFKCTSIGWHPGPQKILSMRGVFISNIAIETEVLVWSKSIAGETGPSDIRNLRKNLKDGE